MDRDKLLLQEDKNFLKKIIDKIFRRNPKDFKKELGVAIHKAAVEFKKMGIEDEIVKSINKHSGTRITSIKDLQRHINLIESDESEEGDSLNEKSAFGEWWDEAKDNAFNALAFYPMLTMFLEFDKLIKGNPDASLKITLVYLIIWVLIIGGKISKKHIIANRDAKSWQNLSGDWSKAAKGGGAGDLYT